MTDHRQDTPPLETGAATKKPGRGGKRPGAGRPPGSLGYGGAARKFGISLPGELADRLDATAAAEGIRSGAWIRRAVIRALEALGGK